MFTRKQIEEIAAKLADLSVKDSQFSNIAALNGSEKVPILQDDQNKLTSFGHLVSLIRESEDTSSLPCKLIVKCNTSGAIIRINGVARSSYTGHYGEMVDVQVSATGYVTWFGVITLTDSHTITVPLSAAGSSSGGGGGDVTPSGDCCCPNGRCVCWRPIDDDYDPTVTQHSVIVTNPSGGATLKIFNNPANIGQTYWFNRGDRVVIDITKDGYYAYNKTIESITQNYVINADEVLIPINAEEETFLSFAIPEVNFDAEGNLTKPSKVSASSFLSWRIQAESLPPYEQDSTGETAEEPALSVSPRTLSLVVGDHEDIVVKS